MLRALNIRIVFKQMPSISKAIELYFPGILFTPTDLLIHYNSNTSQLVFLLIIIV